MAADESIATECFQKYRNHYFPVCNFDFNKLANNVVSAIDYRKDDVIVAAYPKAGTTWTISSLRELYHNEWGVCRVGDRFMEPVLEWLAFKDDVANGGLIGESREQFLHNHSDIPSPRLLRSHLPYEFLPMKTLTEKGTKIIYVSRNPKDVCTSYYHFMKAWRHGEWAVPWQQLVECDFIDGRTVYGPYTRHTLSWYSHGLDENILHVTYEDMKRNYKSTMKKVSEFLKKPVTDADLDRTEERCSFSQMNRNDLPYDDVVDLRGSFCRKGMIGDWKNHFTVAQSEHFDKYIGSELTKHGINFIYE